MSNRTEIARNDPCACGSGKKYKKCCLPQQEARQALESVIRENVRNAVALRAGGNLVTAEAILQEVLQIEPNQPDALHWLGVIACESKMYDVAVDLISHAIAVEPDAQKYHNLGVAYKNLDKPQNAINCYMQSLTLKPDYTTAHQSLGVAYNDLGKTEDAVRHFQLASNTEGPSAKLYFQIGVAFQSASHNRAAEDCYRKVLALDPNHVAANNNLGMMLRDRRDDEGAKAYYRKAIELKNDYAEAHNNLAGLLMEQGDTDGAIASYRKALSLNPTFTQASNNLVFCMLYSPRVTPEEIMEEFKAFRDRHEVPVAEHRLPHDNDADPERRLRIGYVSGDFWGHAVAYFIEPILANHDKTRHEVFCYYNRNNHDATTERIKASVDHFIPCARLSDAALTERIRADGIDILIDLSNHTASNRLLTFARKPAPIQVTWIGLPSSTGLASMDYRFTDAHLDPPGMTERYHTEKLVRLSISSPYLPPAIAPETNALPALTGTPFTFASLNNLAKISDEVLTLWSRILQQTPGSRLMLANTESPLVRKRIMDLFAAQGIAPERLILHPRMKLVDYLTLHHEIDLSLDPFPYNGGTTTRHSLYMGVPVVTLEGKTTWSRVGCGLMRRYDLGQFVAATPEQYVEIAVGMVGNLDHLNQVRVTLRERMQNAPFQDHAATTRHVEAAYRQMWRDWCAQRTGERVGAAQELA